MSTFTGKTKSAQSVFTKKNKDTDVFSNTAKSSLATFSKISKDNATWTGLQHSDMISTGMDVQTMDSTISGMDSSGNLITTSWSVINKETG